ncbi:MAG: carbamoyl phosphate synthase large subunit, partial [Myxococcales bacterium]|nr:carbamoyl phosphate synthase large subunit [Myxococcales bacterium]
LMNVQFAVQAGEIYILEVNPRASRTVPFVSKAIGVPLAKHAARVMNGSTLAELGAREVRDTGAFAVKESVFPFIKFPGVDVILGPEMRSTGEVMGIDRDFGAAFAKSQLAAGTNLPRAGTVFLSIGDPDKSAILPAARRLAALGFQLLATTGTRQLLVDHGLACEHVHKVHEGRPHIVDRMLNGDIHMVINTIIDSRSMQDSFSIRRTALNQGIPYFTTSASAEAAAEAIATLVTTPLEVKTLQEYHAAKA